jgi:hypothetical protein
MTLGESMKRIVVRPGKVAMVSDALVEKINASRVMFNREVVLAIAAAEPRGTTVFAGPVKPKFSRRGPKSR